MAYTQNGQNSRAVARPRVPSSDVQQQMLAIYHLYLVVDEPSKSVENREQRRTLVGSCVQPVLDQIIQGVMEAFHEYQQKEDRKASVRQWMSRLRVPSVPMLSQSRSTEMVLETQQFNSLPTGFPEPRPMRPLH